MDFEKNKITIDMKNAKIFAMPICTDIGLARSEGERPYPHEGIIN